MTGGPAIPPRQPPPSAGRRWRWRSQATRGLLWQLALVLALSLVAWYLTRNTLENMRTRGIQSGFDFLLQPAGFAIGESIIDFDSGDPYWKAFLIGLGNTLRTAVAGIVLCTLLGTLINRANTLAAAGGDARRAMALYSKGFYYEAKRKGMLGQMRNGDSAALAPTP